MTSTSTAPRKRLSKVDGHWLWVGGPVPPGSIGITLGALVIVRKSAARSEGFAELLVHEQVHVRQFAELGTARFLARYLKSYARFRLRGYGHWQSYVRIPLEIEARVDARTSMQRRRAPRGGDFGVSGETANTSPGASAEPAVLSGPQPRTR